MAETNSIASRMEKLAKLKRMKRGLSGDAVAKKAEPTPASEPVPQPEMTEAPQPSATLIPPVESVAPAAPAVAPPEEIADLASAFEPVAADEATVAETPEPVLPDMGDGLISPADTPSDSVALDAETASDDPDAAFDEAIRETEASFNFSADDSAESDADLPSLDEIEAFDSGEDELDTAIPSDLMDDDVAAVEAELDMEAASASDEAPEIDPVDEQTAAEDDTPTVLAESEAVLEAAGPTASDDSPLEDLVLAAGAGGAVAGLAIATSDEPDMPDFSASEIDTELLEQEFAHEAQAETAVAGTEELTDGRVSLTFDDARSTLLNHVSRQMNCSIEDVVVTALDWYLDALFGEEEQARAS